MKLFLEQMILQDIHQMLKDKYPRCSFRTNPLLPNTELEMGVNVPMGGFAMVVRVQKFDRVFKNEAGWCVNQEFTPSKHALLALVERHVNNVIGQFAS